ncbi:MAG: UvrD-helicase domain-containing protein, partial [Deltaproteobacteria bacterium]|nr:UvrD-helicase domain-containing protein [Deltaproteobacteria bacterium]
MEQITASAGSGKTYALTRRYLRHLARALPDGGPSLCLLEGGDRPSRENAPYSLAGILAATFTNKAAAEMQARVIRELKQQALETGAGIPGFPLTPDQARHWIEVILRRFDAVNIRTIDSLLNLLVRLNALSLSLPPDFTPLFSLDEALAPLYDALLDQADREPEGRVANLFREACRSLLFHHRAKGVAAGDILRKRLRELIDLHLNGAPLPREEDGRKAAAMLASLCAAMREAADALAGFLEEERLACNANAAKFLQKCRECPAMSVPDFADAYACKESLDDWLNKPSKGMASEDARRAFHDLCTAYGKLKKYGPPLVTTREYMPLVALAEPLLDGLEAVQKGEGSVPAMRLPSLALESLESGGVSDAFCRLGDTLVHLLFDEFQDTSTDQWRAIMPLVEECLARGGSLTYVGDVKQAIYGWRGGNAELFNAVARDTHLTRMLPAQKPEVRHLESNWRSAPAIVYTNNRIFGQLEDPAFTRRILEAMLPAATDPAVFADAAGTLAEAFAGCRQDVPEKNRSKEGFVRLTRIEARYTADLLEDVRETLRKVLLDDVLVRRSPGDVAVLVRTNREAGEVSGWLAEWQVPVATEHSFRLGGHPLVTRLVDTLTFLEYPLDDAAFWSAVGSPELFGNATPDPETLTDWLATAREHPSSPPLYTAYRKRFPAAWQRTLGPFHDQTGLLSAYDMVRELIRHCRLFERYPEQAPFLQRFSEVAFAAESKGFSSLSAFLDFWARAGVEERVPMPENMDAVRILSMHKAKGLEFPVVVVPFHHQADPPYKPLAVDESSGLPLVTYRENSAAESVRAIMEQINLLYVAWTRPTEELYAFITQSGHSASRSSLGKAIETLLE